jgi:aerobic carbon-monoxide dehydrogenase large subunit
MATHLGRSIPRVEDERFLRGAGRFTADVAVDSALHLHVVRSPHAHAAIGRIDGARAAALAGMHGVFTAADLHGLGAMPCVAALDAVEPLIIPPRYALARERARHVGEPVAFVVADNRDIARDAAELVEVDYEPLPAIVGGPAALALGAPLLWQQAPGNQAYRVLKGDRAAVERAFATAAHVVEAAPLNSRVIIAPVEPRAAIATYDVATDTLDLLLTGQSLHGIRRQLANDIFKLPPERIQLRAPDVGGGFGMKNFLYPEWIMLLWAARRLRAPVAWVADRSEEFVAPIHGRDVHATARLALDAEGRFLALDVAMIADLGAYASSFGPHIATNSASTAMGGIYAIPAICMDVRGAFTTATPIDAYRGAGKPEANYITERTIDAAARALGRDPRELRRQNMIASFPYRTALGMTIDSGRFTANLDDAGARADVAGFAARRAEAAKRGKLRGLGTACFLETSRGAANEGCEIRFDADGKIAIIPGTESNGQGHETSYAQIAADRLGLPMSAFRYVQADTRAVRTGAGHGGARSMHLGGGAAIKAIDAMLEKARRLAAHLLQASADELTYSEGRFSVRNTGRSIELLALAKSALDARNLPDGVAPSLDTHAMNMSDTYVFPSGCHVAEVEIDPETGATTLVRYTAVDDYGRLINPMLTEGQVHGGITQGIGQALLERTVYDPESGQLLTGSFMDYAVPRADDLPAFDITLAELPTQGSVLGVKGSGQAGAIAAPQTVIHAILDALAPLGVTRFDMPATPERVWRAIQSAKR